MAEYYTRLLYSVFIIVLFMKHALMQISTTTTVSPLVAWKQAFVKEAKWSGYYVYDKVHIACKLNVHSVQLDQYGVVLATFKDQDAEFDMQGVSDDGKIIIFRMSTAQKISDRIPIDSGFKLSGALTKDKRTTEFWTYHGNSSVIADNRFGEFVMFAGDASVVNAGGSVDESNRVALTVGISLGAAVLGVALLVGIGIWAVKSGYLRHVPANYRNFQNDAAFSNSDKTVHI